MLRTRNNADSNKLVIFSGVALYYGDTYIILPKKSPCAGDNKAHAIAMAALSDPTLLLETGLGQNDHLKLLDGFF